MVAEIVKREPILIRTLRGREPFLPFLRPFRLAVLDLIEGIAVRFRTPEVLADVLSHLAGLALAPLMRERIASFLKGERLLWRA